MNRTIMELRLISLELYNNIVILYESNHNGIETKKKEDKKMAKQKV